jgi:hypothetical protein
MVSCSQLHTCHEKKVAYVLRIVRVWIGGNTVRWWRRSGFQSIGYTVFGPRMILKSQTKKNVNYRTKRNKYSNEKYVLLSCPLVRTGVSVAR